MPTRLRPRQGSAPAHPQKRGHTRSSGMLLTIAIVLLALWLLGFVMKIAGGLVHIVLVIAVIVAILHFVRGRSV